MPIILPSGFNVTSVEPVDARFALANQAARLGLSTANVYKGLVVFQQDNNTLYVLLDPTQPSLNTSWQVVGSTVSGSLVVTGSITAVSGFTGSLFGTASWAINAISASVTPNAVVTASVVSNTITFTKGDGTTFPITVAGGGGGSAFPFTGSAIISGSLQITGSVVATQGLTGSLSGTASWASNAVSASFSNTALTASYVLNAISSSFAATASFAPAYVLSSVTSSMLAPYVLSSQTSSMTVASASFATSSSRAVTASVALNNIVTASVITNTITFTKGDGSTFPITVNTGSVGTTFPFTGSAIISGSLQVIGSLTAGTGGPDELVVTATGVQIGSIITDIHSVTGSLRVSGSISGSIFGTSSWAINAVSASIAQNAVSSSFAQTASLLLGSVQSASFASTASATPNAVITASVVSNTITFTKGDGTTFPITVAGGGGGATFPFTGSAIISGSLQVTGSIRTTEGITGSLFGTSSWSVNAVSAAFAASILDQGYVHTQPTSNTIWSITHSLQTLTPLVNVYTDDYYQVIPQEIYSTSVNTLTVLFSSTISGFAIVSKGSGTAITSSYAVTASFVPNALVTASISSSTITFTKGDGSTFPIVVSGGSGGGTTTNPITFDDSGSGAVPGTTFDGSVARTISYNSIGANKVITYGTAAPSGGVDGDIYLQYV